MPLMCERQRVLGMWVAVLGIMTVFAADWWIRPWSFAIGAAGWIAFFAGAWWTLSLVGAVVVWLPWMRRPTVYYDPDQVRTGPGGDVEFSPDLDRAMVRARLWQIMGWRDGVRAWARSSTRWNLLVRTAAERVRINVERGVRRRVVTTEEVQWLSSTWAATVLGKRLYECGIELGDELRRSRARSRSAA